MSPLISEGIRCGVHVALTSVRSHYDGVNFDAIGRGYALRKSNNDILAIGSAAARCAKILVNKVSAASVRL